LPTAQRQSKFPTLPAVRGKQTNRWI